MGYTFEFDPVKAILQSRFSGEITEALFQAHYSAARQLAARFLPRAGILDLSGATTFEVTPQFLRVLARQEPALADASVPRIVIAPPDYISGMLRMFQMLGEDTRPLFHVVRTREAAYSLLGIHEAHFEPVEAIHPD